jgi:hypothetical protein
VLHGRLGSWLTSATELPGAQKNLTSSDSRTIRMMRQTSKLSAVRAFAAFTHRSIWQHVVLPSRAAGASVRVVMHSWSPEAADILDRLYQPAASKHEPPLLRDKVESQHTSMRRALELLDGLGAPTSELIMVARLDLLLFADVPLVTLASGLPRAAPASAASSLSPADVLYLPHTCVPSRLRVPPGLWALESHVLRRTCSGSAGHRAPKGRRMLPAQLTRYDPTKVRTLDPAADFTLFVLDYFFIGTPAVAKAFGGIAASLPELAGQLRQRFRRHTFPQWSHLYWAQLVTGTLVPMGVSLRFVMVHEADFTLARFWRYGADCITRVRRHDGSDDRERGGDAAWAGFENVTAFARGLRGSGGAALGVSPLAEQCPRELESATHVLCPWYSRACAARAAAVLELAEAAGQFQTSAQLPPRQLMSAERCMTPACLNYVGTARKSTRQG